MKADATILLIDDDADDQEIFALAVDEVNPSYQCVTAKNGIEALEKLKDGEVKPDCIFLDLNMPRMNGKQCLAEIKKHSELYHIPVVIYTTSSEHRDKDQMLAMGASAFITKPPHIDELITGLGDVFNQIK